MQAHSSTEMIWTHLSGDLRKFVRRRVCDEHAADDLLQEVFVRIHGHLATLQNVDRLVPWVYRIARNVVAEHYRRAPAKERALVEEKLVAEATESSDDLLNQAGLWLDELIAELPEKYRVALRLAELEGFTQQEVANLLGLSLAGAKSRVQRGRALLREQLDRCCQFEIDRRGNLTDCIPLPERTVCRACDDLPGRP